MSETGDSERAKIFVELYKHEDELVWTKLGFVLTYTTILIASWAFTLDKKNNFPDFVSGKLIPIVGIISSLLFLITVYNSQQYLRNHAKEWRRVMYPDSNLDCPIAGVKWLSTSRITLLTCGAIIIFWLYVLFLFKLP